MNAATQRFVEAIEHAANSLAVIAGAFASIAESHARIAAVLDESAATGNVHITVHQDEHSSWHVHTDEDS